MVFLMSVCAAPTCSHQSFDGSSYYRSLQVYQQSNTQVGHRVLSDFTLKIVRQMSDQIVRQMSDQIVRQMSDQIVRHMSDQILPGRSESLYSQIVKL